MDPEKQPLLCPVSTKKQKRYSSGNMAFMYVYWEDYHASIFGYSRPLSPEEVYHIHHEVTWRRARFFLIIMFWSIIAMMLSIITCLLVTAPRCNAFDKAMSSAPVVPPVHLSLASLVSYARAANAN